APIGPGARKDADPRRHGGDELRLRPRHLHGAAPAFAGDRSLCQVSAASAGLRRGAHARGDARDALCDPHPRAPSRRGRRNCPRPGPSQGSLAGRDRTRSLVGGGSDDSDQALYPEQFSMTAGVNVPFDLALIEDLYDALPRRLGETKHTDLIDDRRFAETIYRVALADGIMDRVTYQDPPEDAS